MKNQMKTFVLLAALTGLLVGLGSVLGGRFGFGRTGGATIGLMFGLVMNLGAYWFSDKIALKMSRARPVSEEEAPRLYEMVRRLTVSAGLPMPSLHIIPSEQPNAFATGRDPDHAAIAVTEGIMAVLEPHELEGVIAHELAHVRNRDILISSVAAAVAGAISWIGTMARWGAIFGGGDDEEGGQNIIVVLLASIAAGFAALLIQMAISRSREYLADATGARICGRPESLASALMKIDAYSRRLPMPVNPSAAPMYIINPLSGLRGGMASWFSTHPPTEERVRRLQSLTV